MRLRGTVPPEASELHERGTVLRVDGRGVLVRLDSGRSVLFEPRMLETVDP